MSDDKYAPEINQRINTHRKRFQGGFYISTEKFAIIVHGKVNTLKTI